MRDREVVAEASRWLRFAREDLVTAERLSAQGQLNPRHVCWLAQQGAEQALKAALILEGVDFPFRYDLDAFPNLLPEGWSVKEEYPDLSELTERAGCRGAVSGRLFGSYGRRRGQDASPGVRCFCRS